MVLDGTRSLGICCFRYSLRAVLVGPPRPALAPDPARNNSLLSIAKIDNLFRVDLSKPALSLNSSTTVGLLISRDLRISQVLHDLENVSNRC
jgi:hypothetical protein